jgi:hypothetical protein
MPFRIGKGKIDALILQAQEAQSCLEMDPKTTLNYVNYLSFLENAPKMVRIGSVLWYMNKCSFNPLSVQFKSLLHGQQGCVFFSGRLNLRTCQYFWVHLAWQATFKSSTFWYVRAGKGLIWLSGLWCHVEWLDNLLCGMVDNCQHFKESSMCHEVFPAKTQIAV